ncbi:hypothetical protein PanWU01x14_037800 [Parasponia andersonii]|uniref:Uncharacterized protein n=1 Tax=Parasponia andersonii TaxID=3476 RepID=A0A2P5DS04_PARAD|nr:hypothetical protein PanWU01x14_037800 [Parasponia andersonii]
MDGLMMGLTGSCIELRGGVVDGYYSEEKKLLLEKDGPHVARISVFEDRRVWKMDRMVWKMEYVVQINS